MTRMPAVAVEMHTGWSSSSHEQKGIKQCKLSIISLSHRSPWTNEYVPQLPDGTKPSPRLRVLEEQANDAFSIYREMYYEGTGISSVYLWDLDDPNASNAGSSGTSSFAGVVLLKKTAPGGAKNGGEGTWDSIHVFEVSERSRTGNYKLTSTVSLSPPM